MNKTATSRAVSKFRGKVPDQHQLLVNLMNQASQIKQEEKSHLVTVNQKWQENCKLKERETGQRRNVRKTVTWSKNLLRMRSISPRPRMSPPSKVARFSVTPESHHESTPEPNVLSCYNISLFNRNFSTVLEEPTPEDYLDAKEMSQIITTAKYNESKILENSCEVESPISISSLPINITNGASFLRLSEPKKSAENLKNDRNSFSEHNEYDADSPNTEVNISTSSQQNKLDRSLLRLNLASEHSIIDLEHKRR